MTYPRFLIPGGLVAGTLALLMIAACGGGGDGGNGADGGDGATPTGDATTTSIIACDTFRQKSYRYTVEGMLEVTAIEGTPVPSAAPGPNPYTFAESIEGSVEDGANIRVAVSNTDGINTTNFEGIELDDGRGWTNFDGGGWEQQDTTERPLPIRYRPAIICEAIAPDLTSSVLAGEPEEVNGVASTRYTLDDVPPAFFARDLDFGAASDLFQYGKTADATVWVADDGDYLTKLDITGYAQYPAGQPMTMRLVFELGELDDGIAVDAPN